nr:MAG TPA: hypothetical protein [Caudoviricetes sp.]
MSRCYEAAFACIFSPTVTPLSATAPFFTGFVIGGLKTCRCIVG